MLKLEDITYVIHHLDSDDEDDGEFVAAFDRIIKLSVNMVKNTEELQEEIIDYDDLYQVFITDIDFNFWLKVSNGSIIYQKGLNKSASFKVKYTKDLMIKILKQETSGTDAFMRGLIKVDGNYSQGLRYIKLFRLVLRYMNEIFKKN
ncbi:hypothetical protein LCGC14_1416370 [marine sediment metagenome]|uniref:SCP2 domain-containing protein n=1 Tax=marine sediment metagenome TaxID=412755 RepID=A0A0F9JT51_9ZZZZ